MLFDLLDTLIWFIIRLIPIFVALVSFIISYYYYTRNESLMKLLKGESFNNYFENRKCYKDDNNKCKFDLTKKHKLLCPEHMCYKETFINNDDFVCFDGNNCISKKKDFVKPCKNNCGYPKISNYPSKVYTSIDECYKENISHKYLNKRDCLQMPHGYGWLDGEGCVKGTPEGPETFNTPFFLYGKNRRLYTPSNPNPYILPVYNSYFPTNLM